MAKFEVSGFEEFEKKLLRREKAVVEAAPEMVKAGAEVLEKFQRTEIETMFKSDRTTGDLAASIASTDVASTETETYCHVYPQGKNRRGQRNATVGFVLHYGRTGRGEIAPSRWLTAANEKASDQVNAAMRKVWRDKQK